MPPLFFFLAKRLFHNGLVSDSVDDDHVDAVVEVVERGAVFGLFVDAHQFAKR